MRTPSLRYLLVALAASALSCGSEDPPRDPEQDAANDQDAAVNSPDAEADPPDADEQPTDASDEEDANTPEPSDAGVDASKPPPCETVAPTACPTPAPSYPDIVPILEARCLSCHDGTGDQWPLTSYDHVVSWTDQIRGMMLNCSMPPRESGIEMPLEERQTILEWLRCGAPE